MELKKVVRPVISRLCYALALLVLAFVTEGPHSQAVAQTKGLAQQNKASVSARRHNDMETVEITATNKQIEGRVFINRAPETIFAFYSDFRNLPKFLGDVMDVQLFSPMQSRWTIEGPFGMKAHWDIEITKVIPNVLIRYQVADSSIAHSTWEIRFEPTADPSTTEVTEVLTATLGKLELAAMALIGKYPQDEVRANLHRLKQLLETGQITDTSYAVKGKFAP